MPRIKIDLPGSFSFQTVIPIRITDLNYGGHVGNDTILSLIHEARVQYLRSLGYQELDVAGVGLIMSDVAIDFKRELFYEQQVTVSVTATEFSKATFELYYKLEITMEGKASLIATAKTGMVCYDYGKRKITTLPDEARTKLSI